MTPIKNPMALISKPTGCALKKLFHSLRFHILIILRLITTVLTKVTKRKSRRPRKTVGRNDGSEMSGKRSVSTATGQEHKNHHKDKHTEIEACGKQLVGT